MNIDAYLRRINYNGQITPTAETLQNLHVAHMMAVPFENLSVHLKEKIILDEHSFYEKIVNGRRGGFCYELNGLFAALLRELGFEVKLLSACVAKPGGGYKPEFDHLVLGVSLEQDWLADVGFGDSFCEPLLLKSGIEQVQGNRTYCLDADRDRLIMKQRNGAGEWIPRFRFGLEPHELSEFNEMCLFHQTSPESHFTQSCICSIATPKGRITVADKKLIITENGIRQERDLKENEYNEVIYKYFGIKLS